MSESSPGYESHAGDQEPQTASARARVAIESAIATLQAHRQSLSEGQIKAIKRIIYWVPNWESRS